jgi:pimeloyl-ACP methyl ester carboxylesterase
LGTGATAPTLLLLPGMGCDARLWRAQLPVLAEHGPVQVAAPHLTAEETDDLPALAQRLLDAAPAGPLALAGCSMGAMLALHAWTLAPPGRIVALALLGTTARPDTRDLQRLRAEACEQFAAGQMASLLRVNAMFAFHGDHLIGCLDDYLDMVQSGGVDALIRQNRLAMNRPDLRPMLASVTCPTLVVGGEDDGLTPPACAREIAEALPDAELVLLPRCGHMLTWEHPERVTELLLQWRRRWPAHPVAVASA